MTRPPSSSPRLRRRRAGAWLGSFWCRTPAPSGNHSFRACTSRMDAADGHRQKARSSGRQRPRHVVVPRPGYRNAAEPAGGQELGQRPAGEQAQVACHHAARPAEHSAQAHLGEDRLDPEGEQPPVVPRGQVRRGQQQRATRPEHPPGLGDRPVGVHQMLDQLAHDHHVRGAVRDRQARRGHARAHHREAEGLRLAQGVAGPVDPGEPVRRIVLGRDGERGAVAAAQVDDHRRAGTLRRIPASIRAWRRARSGPERSGTPGLS